MIVALHTSKCNKRK